MKHLKSFVALMLCLAMVLGVGVFSAFAINNETAETGAATGITVHFYHEGGTPYVYYWNALPKNIETAYPGVKMSADAASGANWYKYEFKDVTKINLMFTDGTNTLDGQLTDELTRNAGEWWYKNGKWKSSNPVGGNDDWERGDMREETIYFVITTRFYDGDKGNNVHCWDDKKAQNPDSDPAWRGDFKGLAEKLDYIKALGFSAIWITPVVENASGYDYHGYHALDFSTVDARYESSDFTYQDLIDAAHEKDMKIVQDVVWNHSGNFGEAFLAPMFEKEYSSLKDLESIDSMKIIEGSKLSQVYPNYNSLNPDAQYQARLAVMKEDANDTNHYYHHDKSLSYGSYTEQTGQMAGDCVDINTENPTVAKYITDTYMDYVNMGVDCFRLDTEKHINRWTLNNAYFPVFNKVDNFYIFGEVCARYHGAFNEGGASDSCFFYTWKEDGGASWSSDWKANYDTAVAHYGQYQNREENWNSNNAFLNGINYHTPDYSKANGTGVIDFPMHWAYMSAGEAYGTALGADKYYNDATWNVVYVDSHDYSPDNCQRVRYTGGTTAWAENWSLMFTFRGIPCVYYGSEVEFQKGMVIDDGPNCPLSTTGRAYFGENIEGTVSASDFSEYTASGKVQQTLSSPLAKHLSKLNAIRREIPALQKGQYTTDGQYVSGNMAYIRRYTNAQEGVDSLALVTVSGGATFRNIPNGKYVDAVTGDVQNVTNGTLTANCSGQGNLRVYVCCASGFDGISGAIGGTSGQTYLK